MSTDRKNRSPTDYSYFLDKDGDVWRQAPGSDLYEINDSGLWHGPYPDRPLVVLRPLLLGEPILPTEPGLYVVNYSKDRSLYLHEIVCLEGAEWRHLDSWDRWMPSDGDMLTRLDVVEGK